MTKKILIITDSGAKKFLGYGHIFRCLNIANFLKKKYEITFFCKRKETHKVLREQKSLIDEKNQKVLSFKREWEKREEMVAGQNSILYENEKNITVSRESIL